MTNDSAFLLVTFSIGALACFAAAFRIYWLSNRRGELLGVRKPAMQALALTLLCMGIQYASFAYLRWLRDGIIGQGFSSTPAYSFVQGATVFTTLVLLVALWLYPSKE